MVRPPVVLCTLVCAMLGVVTPGICQELPVYRVKLEGNLSEESFAIVEHLVRQATVSGGAAIVLELDADGDDIELAHDIVGLLDEADVAVYAYVNRRALNAAALLALASDSIYMSPDATLGGNEEGDLPLVIGADSGEISVTELFGDYAAGHGVDRRIGEAMVDSSIRHGGFAEPDAKMLLTTQRALELGLAVRAVNSVESLVSQIRLADARVRTINEDWLSTTITVQNNNWRDINIFVLLSGGMQIRMGTVTSMNSSTYTVPGNMLHYNTYVRVAAEIIGSDDRIETETVRVVPGLVVQWRIENVLRNSNYFIWIRS